MVVQEKLPEFNNLAEQKAYALQKTDELLAELHKTKLAFDTAEEIQRLTELFTKAKDIDVNKPEGMSDKELRFYTDVAKFPTVEEYIADLKEKADVQIQTFLSFRQTLAGMQV